MPRDGLVTTIASAWLFVAGITAASAQVEDQPAVHATATIAIRGILTRQGPDRRSFWAITDSDGRTWRIIKPTPQEYRRYEAFQNQFVIGRVQIVQGTGVRVLRMRLDPARN